MPVMVVPMSLATVAIDTFMTVLSSVIRNCADASVKSTIPVALAAVPTPVSALCGTNPPSSDLLVTVPARRCARATVGPVSAVLVSRFLALGDSFTEGLSDLERPDGRPLGWADRLAAALAMDAPDLTYANLAIRGKLLRQVVDEQIIEVPALIEDAEATLVSFHAGPNDVLRPRADVPDVRSEYELAVRELSGLGVRLLLFTVIPRVGGTGRTAQQLAARFEAFNDGVRACVERYGATLVDLGSLAPMQDRRLWNDDRLHLAPQGHRRVAAAALSALGSTDEVALGGPPGWWTQPLPPASSRGRAQDLREDAAWFRRHLVPWAIRRMRGTSSGDGMTAKQPLPQPVVAATI
jgi:lysophospholipase L1-like esterase